MAENQHYVPQFLLRNFSSNEQIHVLEIRTQKAFRTNPKNIMAERDYNVVDLKEDKFIDFESRFTYIESLARPVVNKIIETEEITSLSPDEVARLHIFVVVQHLRSRVSRNNSELFESYIRENFEELKTNDFPEYFSDEAYARFCHLKIVTENIAEFAKHMARKHFILMKKECAGNLYISDTPVTLHNEKKFGPYGNIGIAVPFIEIYMPISPKLVLAFLCPASIREIKQTQAQLASQINKKKLWAWLTGAFMKKSYQAEISEQTSKLADSQKYLSTMIEEKKVHISSDNLLFLNSLQIMWANRFIVAERDDFSFARECLDKNPGWNNAPSWTIN